VVRRRGRGAVRRKVVRRRRRDPILRASIRGSIHAGASSEGPIDHVTLTAGVAQVSLSDAMRARARFAAAFDTVLQKFLDGMPDEPRATADVLLFARFKAGTPEPEPSGAP
jgi:hypothetical protein